MHKYLYKGLQGCYWMMYSASYGYLTYYLETLGFSAGLIGMITAGFGILGILIQPTVGRIADNPKVGWKKPLVIMISLAAVAAILQMISPLKVLTGLVAGFVTLIEGSMLSLVNQACFACSTEEEQPDFGSARGTGSVTYAIVSVTLGNLTGHLGSSVIPYVQLVIAILMLLDVWKLPCIMPVNTGEKQTSSGGSFFKKYPKVLPVFIGINFLMLFHCMCTTYIIRITDRVGGGSKTMGIALAIAAVAEIPVMFGFGLISKKIRTNLLIFLSGLFFIVKALFYIFSPSVMWIYAGQCFQLLSFAVYANAIVYFSNENVASQDATRGQAYMAVPIAIGTVAGSLIGGFILEKTSVTVMCVAGLIFATIGTVILGIYCLANNPQSEKCSQ